jgi:hypothetical protein
VASWYGFCDSQHGIAGPWMGPQRATEDAAQQDVNSHNSAYAGHSAEMEFDSSGSPTNI